eukprot:TRINITY_DN22091_c0_g1_i1.p1 TRINITY_DN22091_c0_g1~~TRINITY_DN22091_c0_g1_i1.p1  ORF type:complete len:338 (-),score=77.94 TRINITY_DN22091_c0_g1_i1:219-1232(-)
MDRLVFAKAEDVPERILKDFQLLDMNMDGTVSKEELLMVLQTLDSERWTDAKVNKLFQSIDLNADGRIQLKEWVDWVFQVEGSSGGAAFFTEEDRQQQEKKRTIGSASGADITLEILRLGGEVALTLTMKSSSTVNDVKKRIQEALGIHSSSQELVYKEVTLKKARATMEDYGLQDGTALVLTVIDLIDPELGIQLPPSHDSPLCWTAHYERGREDSYYSIKITKQIDVEDPIKEMPSSEFVQLVERKFNYGSSPDDETTPFDVNGQKVHFDKVWKSNYVKALCEKYPMAKIFHQEEVGDGKALPAYCAGTIQRSDFEGSLGPLSIKCSVCVDFDGT